MTRVTQHAVALTSLQGLNGNLAALQRLQQQMTSGKTISQPSDDPTGTNTSMIVRQGMAGATQQARNITDGQTFLDSTDSALQNMLDQVRKVRDLTVQALNNGALDGPSQQAIATQVQGIREIKISTTDQGLIKPREHTSHRREGYQNISKSSWTGERKLESRLGQQVQLVLELLQLCIHYGLVDLTLGLLVRYIVQLQADSFFVSVMQRLDILDIGHDGTSSLLECDESAEGNQII